MAAVDALLGGRPWWEAGPASAGNGAAIKRGARAASGEILAFMDADGQHDPALIPLLLDKLEEGYDRMRAAYAHAIAEKYRFYSYGDSSLLLRAAQDEPEDDF